MMRRLDRRQRLAFVDLTEGGACPLDRSLMLARLHARGDDGVVVSGARAFALMWRQIPVMRPLGLLAMAPPVLWLLERLYRAFLKIRVWRR